jgi:outer membrane cobalamin receptor
VALAIRYDSPSDFDSEFSPRLSITLTRQSDLTTSLKSHLTKSYRAPSFNDLYWPRDAFAVGNPDLIPETGLNFDVGINLSFPYDFINTSAAVNFFNNNVTDLILWAQDPALNNLWTPNNISETQTTGLETSLTLDFFEGSAVLNAEYTFMKALDKGPDPSRNGTYLIYRHKNKLDATSTFRIGSFEWNILYHYVGLRYTDAANIKSLDPVGLFDTNITYRQPVGNYSLSATLEMTNITDEDYQRVLNTAEPGRLIKGTLAINL